MKSFKVRVTKAGTYSWYKPHIGEVFEVTDQFNRLKIWTNHYNCTHDERYMIDKSHCEVITKSGDFQSLYSKLTS